jgi:hypothetical protein
MENMNGPILCNTESDVCDEMIEINNGGNSLNYIKNLSLSDYPDNIDDDYTNNTIIKNNKCDDNEKIEDILKGLDKHKLDIVDDKFVSKSKFSALIGEMRIDILSMVNLVNVLNSNVSEVSKDNKKCANDIDTLFTKLSNATQMIAKHREDLENKYDNMTLSYDEKIYDLNEKVEQLQKIINENVLTNDNSYNETKSKKHSKVMLDNGTYTNQKKQEKHEKNDKHKKKDVVYKSKNDEIFDMKNNDKKIHKTKSKSKDESDTKSIIYNSATRQMHRKELYDINLKKGKETKSIRANRLGLQSIL